MTSRYTFYISSLCCYQCQQWGNRKSQFDTTSCYWFTVFVAFDSTCMRRMWRETVFCPLVLSQNTHPVCLRSFQPTKRNSRKKVCSTRDEVETLGFVLLQLLWSWTARVAGRFLLLPPVKWGCFNFLFHTDANNANVKTHGFAFTCLTLICYPKPILTNSTAFIMSRQSSVRSNWDNNVTVRLSVISLTPCDDHWKVQHNWTKCSLKVSFYI